MKKRSSSIHSFYVMKTTEISQKTLLSVLLLLFCTLIGYGQGSPFISIWKTDNPGVSNNNQITIPAEGWYYYTWTPADDLYDPSPPFPNEDELTITFPETGTYIIEITPLSSIGAPFDRIKFNNSGDKEKLIEITQWGDTEWSSFKEAYYGASNLEITADDIPDLSNVDNMHSAFRNTNISTVPNMNNWNTGNIEDMGYTFAGTSNFNQDIGDWDVSHVIHMDNTFNNASAFDQNLGSWNISDLFTATDMFNNSGLSCLNYSLTIKGWAENPDPPFFVELGADQIEYSPEIVEDIDYLITNYDWTFDGHAEGTCTLSSDPIDWDTAYITIWKTDNPGESNNTQINIPAS
ncbi:MAG TPA: BspA family leucine-rich repeat surface protein, partial [Flavobacteriaceae bacterium]|nr:BspA family leucine-rich repeat surface protein [Flavobacteriaceae bacterium]